MSYFTQVIFEWTKKVFIILLTITFVFLFAYPYFILVSIPSQLYRKFIQYLAKKFRPDLLHMLNVASSAMAADPEILSKPTSVLQISVALEGDFKMEDLLQRAENSYPEARCYLYKWCGYYFWKKDEQFKMSDHIYEYKPVSEGTIMTNEEVDKIRAKVFQNPFKKNKSPWETIVIRNYVSPHGEKGTMFLLRSHHSGADAISLIKQMIDISDDGGESVKRILAQRAFQIPKPSIFSSIHFLLCGPLVNFHEIFTHMFGNSNAWKYRPYEMKKSYWLSSTTHVPVQFVKDIKLYFNVPFGVVTLAAMAGAIGKMMRAQGHKVPKKLTCHNILPKPNHPIGRLTNHAGMALIFLPVNEMDPIKRLKKIDKQFKKFIYTFRVYGVNMISFMFRGLIAKINGPLAERGIIGTVGHTNVAGCEGELTYFGRNYLPGSLSGSTGLFPGACGLSLITFGFRKTLYIDCVGDQKIFSSKEAMDMFATFFKEELELLAKNMV